MKECFCSIFDTREERLIEDDGRMIFRLICNICGTTLDSRVVYAEKSEKKGGVQKAPEEASGEAVSF